MSRYEFPQSRKVTGDPRKGSGGHQPSPAQTNECVCMSRGPCLCIQLACTRCQTPSCSACLGRRVACHLRVANTQTRVVTHLRRMARFSSSSPVELVRPCRVSLISLWGENSMLGLRMESPASDADCPASWPIWSLRRASRCPRVQETQRDRQQKQDAEITCHSYGQQTPAGHHGVSLTLALL